MPTAAVGPPPSPPPHLPGTHGPANRTWCSSCMPARLSCTPPPCPSPSSPLQPTPPGRPPATRARPPSPVSLPADGTCEGAADRTHPSPTRANSGWLSRRGGGPSAPGSPASPALPGAPPGAPDHVVPPRSPDTMARAKAGKVGPGWDTPVREESAHPLPLLLCLWIPEHTQHRDPISVRLKVFLFQD